MDGIDTAAIRSMRDFVARAQAADALCDALDQAIYDRDCAREAGLVYQRQCDALRAENARLREERDTAVSGGYVDALRHWKSQVDALRAENAKFRGHSVELNSIGWRLAVAAEAELAVLRGQITAVQKVLAYRADKDQTLNTISALLSAGSGAALTGDDPAGDRPGHQFYGSGGSQWCDTCGEAETDPIHSGEGDRD